jgi:hypothetical protein
VDPTKILLGDKHAARFISQVRIYWNDTVIVENLAFVYEVNIIRAAFSDEIKRKYPMTFTYVLTLANKERNVYGVYMNLNGIASRSILSDKYEVIIPMTTFNQLA